MTPWAVPALLILLMSGAHGDPPPDFSGYPTLPSDGSQWAWPEAERVVEIGDVHGDFDALVAILKERRLIDSELRWIGGKSHLVVNGDILGRGPTSRKVMDLLMRLEAEAGTAAGKVHVLLGNHEAMTAQGRGMASQEDLASYRDFMPAKMRRSTRHTQMEKDRAAFVEAFREESPYAKWLRRLNSMIRIGDTLFVHGGVGEWALHVDPPALNRTIRSWMAYYQGAGPRPPVNTNWVMGYTDLNMGPHLYEGPLWTAVFSLSPRENHGVVLHQLDEILAKLGAQRVVVGHITMKDRRILLEHPAYGKRVIMTDTAISIGYGNSQPSALQIERGGKVSAHYTVHPEDEPLPAEPAPKGCLKDAVRAGAK